MLTTLLPLRIILPSLRLFSSLVSSTSSSTRFIYSSYPSSLPSICLPSFRRSSNFWFTAVSRTSNGKDMAEGKENTFLKLFLISWRKTNLTVDSHRFEDWDLQVKPKIESLSYQPKSHYSQMNSNSLDRFVYTP